MRPLPTRPELQEDYRNPASQGGASTKTQTKKVKSNFLGVAGGLFGVLFMSVFLLLAVVDEFSFFDPTNYNDGSYESAVTFLEDGNYRQALEGLLDELSKNPTSDVAYAQVAEAYLGLGKSEAAKDVLQRGLYTLPKNDVIGQFARQSIRSRSIPADTVFLSSEFSAIDLSTGESYVCLPKLKSAPLVLLDTENDELSTNIVKIIAMDDNNIYALQKKSDNVENAYNFISINRRDKTHVVFDENVIDAYFDDENADFYYAKRSGASIKLLYVSKYATNSPDTFPQINTDGDARIVQDILFHRADSSVIIEYRYRTNTKTESYYVKLNRGDSPRNYGGSYGYENNDGFGNDAVDDDYDFFNQPFFTSNGDGSNAEVATFMKPSRKMGSTYTRYFGTTRETHKTRYELGADGEKVILSEYTIFSDGGMAEKRMNSDGKTYDLYSHGYYSEYMDLDNAVLIEKGLSGDGLVRRDSGVYVLAGERAKNAFIREYDSNQFVYFLFDSKDAKATVRIGFAQDTTKLDDDFLVMTYTGEKYTNPNFITQRYDNVTILYHQNAKMYFVLYGEKFYEFS